MCPEIPEHCGKNSLHLDWQNIRVTSEDMGEGHRPSRGEGNVLKANATSRLWQWEVGRRNGAGSGLQGLLRSCLFQNSSEEMCLRWAEEEPERLLFRFFKYIFYSLLSPPFPFHLGIEQDFHKNLCSVHVLDTKCYWKRLLLIYFLGTVSRERDHKCSSTWETLIWCLKNEVLFIILHSPYFHSDLGVWEQHLWTIRMFSGYVFLPCGSPTGKGLLRTSTQEVPLSVQRLGNPGQIRTSWSPYFQEKQDRCWQVSIHK